MNFNPMDLIIIKEALYKNNSEEFRVISNFINHLLDIQTWKKKAIIELFGDDYKENKIGERFWNKQQMIEFAYKVNQLKTFKEE